MIELAPLAVAFSGGVDSTFLAAVAYGVSPDASLAITVSSQFVSSKEVVFAKRMAKKIGIRLVCLELDVMQFEDVVQNSKLRCYHCKNHVFKMIKKIAAEKGIFNLVHAINLDDLGDYRPGIKAAEELGFMAPLVDTGFSKSDIRSASKKMELETWNIASQSCLATRIPYDEAITREKLEMIDKGEAVLHELGFDNARARCHGDLARIEVPSDAIRRILDGKIRDEISDRFKKIGFKYTSIDIEGYVTGKMNQF